MNQTLFPLFAVGLALASSGALWVAPPGAQAKPRSRHVERAWTHPEFSRHGVRRVVLLPASTFDGNYRAGQAAPAMWLSEFSGTGYAWIPTSQVIKELRDAPFRGDSLLDAVHGQILKSGRVDRAAARVLADLFSAEAILCLRVDRWQSMNSASSRQTATVELRCTMVDSAGTELWRISGRTHHEGAIVPRFAEAPTLPQPAMGPRVLSTPTGSGGGSGGGGGTAGGGGSGSGPGGGSSGGGGSSPPSGGTGGAGAAGSAVGTIDPALQNLRSTDPKSALVRDLYAPDLPEVYRGALSALFADWVPLLPPPPDPPSR